MRLFLISPAQNDGFGSGYVPTPTLTTRMSE